MKQEIPWSRFAAEAIVIVGSILLAFAIDAWWNERQSDRQKIEYLDRLEAAFEENQRRAESELEDYSIDRELLVEFMEMTPTVAENINADKAWEYFRALWRPNLGELNNDSLSALLDSNPLSMESEPELNAAIALWRGNMGALEGQTDKLQLLEQEIVHLLSLHPRMQPAFAIRDEASRRIPGSLSRAVREDNEIMAKAAQKAQTTSIQNLLLRRVRGQGEIVLELLRDLDIN